MRLGRCADERHHAVALEQHQKRVEVVRCRDGVQDEVEAVGLRRHRVRVVRKHYLIGAEPQCIRALGLGCREQHHVCAERVGELDAHVAQAAESNDSDAMSLADLPVTKGGPRGDAGAEERRGGGRIELVRDAQHELLVHDNCL